MSGNVKLRRCLVVIDSEQLENGSTEDSFLLKRVAEVAAALHAEVEFFHASHDVSVSQMLFASDEEVQEHNRKLAERAESRLSELAAQLADKGIKVSTDSCFDSSKLDALLHKIADVEPDIVFKSMGSRRFFLGLISGPDWELIRKAHAHIWFVSEAGTEVSKLISAIGTTAVDEKIFSKSDFAVFELAERLADLLHAEQIAAHVYQVPKGVASYAQYAPSMGVGNYPVIDPAQENERALNAKIQRTAEAHGEAIRQFAKSFDFDPEKIHLIRGEPDNVLSELAEDTDANLIVMGARNLSRLERVLEPVTAERLLAETPCDILFVRA